MHIQVKACLLGEFAVGKTSLVRRFVEGQFDDKYHSTIGVKISRKVIRQNDLDLKLYLWDLAGGEKFAHYETSHLRGAAGALIVCDLTRRLTLEYFSAYHSQLQNLNPEITVVFVGNKSDLDAELEIAEAEVQAFCSPYDAPYVITSAKTGLGVETAFLTLARLIQAKHEPPHV